MRGDQHEKYNYSVDKNDSCDYTFDFIYRICETQDV